MSEFQVGDRVTVPGTEYIGTVIGHADDWPWVQFDIGEPELWDDKNLEAV